jgi:hypothetical protein
MFDVSNADFGRCKAVVIAGWDFVGYSFIGSNDDRLTPGLWCAAGKLAGKLLVKFVLLVIHS